ncbi:CoA transferase subunit A [Burkholderia pseudomallei]|uniref:CoA transferase subunit A n=1 Tax=Burkholderia pseudomallei TaxID=28450 RepID=UPI0004CDE0CB|nr:3-oxoacid CoA-transferase subunit A [Burkholderia pseudomallei]AIP11423.1 3-oxoadipate CoA-transferase subunit A [Burkholderia pseudomallei]OMW31625.1 3-oxoadipate CoA-transferase [Burkholderia pseudomallei]ONA26221.1 3-oxoadipate CoA-transferase [Burkholderia pseudomallei]ONA35460.1 3-oxoadipate CoA-transferase [Burkholderia pseudomallei]ONA41814.1 3-oxoadipate CoA-transferase [Burkholderia pseudomallei]
MGRVNKQVLGWSEALAGLCDGATVMVGGFGSAGLPTELLDAVLRHGAKDLTVISNNAGYDGEGVSGLIAERRVRKLVCSYPLTVGATAFREAYQRGEIELELVPQGTLAERIRCAGAGLGGFLSPIAVGAALSDGKPVHTVDGIEYVLELPLHADFALIRAQTADRVGNLVYRLSGRNFNPVMATAARIVVAEVNTMVDAGMLDPEHIITPGIFVDRVVEKAGGLQ